MRFDFAQSFLKHVAKRVSETEMNLFIAFEKVKRSVNQSNINE